MKDLIILDRVFEVDFVAEMESVELFQEYIIEDIC